VIAEGGTPRSHGVTKVFTEYGVMSRAGAGEELTLTAFHQGINVEDVIAATGWELQVSPELAVITPPTAAELSLLREEIDPSGVYLR
jgi:glutaconate CoA-transferase subunit B